MGTVDKRIMGVPEIAVRPSMAKNMGPSMGTKEVTSQGIGTVGPTLKGTVMETMRVMGMTKGVMETREVMGNLADTGEIPEVTGRVTTVGTEKRTMAVTSNSEIPKITHKILIMTK